MMKLHFMIHLYKLLIFFLQVTKIKKLKQFEIKTFYQNDRFDTCVPLPDNIFLIV